MVGFTRLMEDGKTSRTTAIRLQLTEREVGWNAKELEVLDELLAETSDVGLTEPPVCDGLEEDEEEGNTPVGIPAREEGKSTIG